MTQTEEVQGEELPADARAMMQLDEAVSLATRLLGRSPDRATVFQPRAGGNDSQQFRLWIGGRGLLLKVMLRSETPLGAYFHARLRRASVPVPELVSFSADGGPLGAACGIFEWVEGRPAEFDSHERPPYDEAEFGRMLRAIHSLRHDRGFGRLDDHGATSHGRWTDWIGDFLEWSVSACVTRRALRPQLAESVLALPARFADDLRAAPPALLHYGDIMHNGNMIIDPPSRRILAVVDFSDAIVGDPRLELAWVDLYFGAHGYFGRGFDLARFRLAYGDEADSGDPLRLLCVALALVTMLTYVDPGSERGRHHGALLERVVSELGV